MESRRPLDLKDGLHQILAAVIAHSIAIQAGINMAFSTILLPHVLLPEHNNTSTNITIDPHDLIINQEQASWVVSLVTITTPVGSLMTGTLMDRFGRKAICSVTTLPFVVSWALVVLTTSNVYLLYFARILAGIGGGLSAAAMVYVSEISHPSLRSMLLSLTSVVVSFGILLTSVLGYILHWKTVAICCGLVATASFSLTLFIPESPSWYVGLRKQRPDDPPNVDMKLAERSLRWLVKDKDEYNKEMQTLMQIKEKRMARKRDRLMKSAGEESAIVTEDAAPLDAVRGPKTLVWKPLCLLLGLFFLQQCSGCYVVIFYAVQIFEQIGSVDLDQFTSLVILGFVRFLMAILTVFLSKKLGRRPLLMSSAAGSSVVMLAAAVYLHVWGPGVVPSVFVLIFVLFSSYGVIVVPWTLISEILPLKFRATGSGVLIASAYILMFFTLKWFITTLDLIGVVWTFCFFSAFSILLVIFVYFLVPETLGKTLEEIEHHFSS